MSHTNLKEEKEEDEQRGKLINERIKSAWKSFFFIIFTLKPGMRLQHRL